MTKMNNFWQLLNCDHTRSTVMMYWTHILGEAFPCIKPLLYPEGGVCEHYPHPHNPDGKWLYVVHYPNGTIGAITDDREFRIPLVEKDILYYALNMGRFRKMLAETLGLEPTVANTEQGDRVMCLGQLEVFPGEKYPVYLVTWKDWSEYKCAISKLLLGIKTPFIMLSGLPRWPNDFLPFCKERNVATYAIGDALEYRDKRLQPTEGWYQTIEAFRKTLKPDNMVAAPPFEFRKKGDMWVIRFDEEDMYLKDSVGLQCIGQLLAKPDDPVFVMELRAVLNGQKPDLIPQPHAREDAVDQVTLSNLKHRYLELQSELEEAQRDGNEIMEEETEREMESIIQYLGQVKAVGGTTRKVNDEIEKARSATSKAFWRSVNQIRNELPKLAEHLEKSCVVGMVCNYTPEQKFDWVL